MGILLKMHREMMTPRSKSELERDSKILSSVLLVLLSITGGIVLFLLGVSLFAPLPPYSLSIMVTTFLLLLPLWFIRHSHPQICSYAVILILIVTVTWRLLHGYGIFDVTMVLIPLVFLLASLILRPINFFFVTLIIFGAISFVWFNTYPLTFHVLWLERGLSLNLYVLYFFLSAFAAVTWMISFNLLKNVREIEQREEKFSTVFNATNDAIFLFDYQHHNIFETNLALRKMFRLGDGDLATVSPFNLCPSNTLSRRKELVHYLHEAIAKGYTDFEWRAKRLNDTHFWTHLSLQKTISQGQECIMGVIRDIDNQRRIEEELRQSEKLTAIGQLAGGISHDFNNQLTGIIGLADLLSKKETDEDSLAKLAAILQSARRAADLTGQLLSFARKGNRTYELMDINLLIQEAFTLLERSVTKQITFTQKLTVDLPQIYGDTTLIQNVLLNLGINARDAQPHGGAIEFRSSRVFLSESVAQNLTLPTKEGHYVCVAIADKGMGIPAVIRQRIFDPFFTTKPVGEGTGMGLSVVYGTIQEHNGGLLVESEVGHGTTISLYFPVSTGKEEIAARPTHVIPLTAKKTPTGRILVVDDEPVLRLTIKLLLEHAGHSVTTVNSGFEALDFYKEHSEEIDIIILDMIMPEMSGLETVHNLMEQQATTPVIIASGFSSGNDLEEVMQSPLVKGYLAKPFKSDELAATVADILTKQKKR